MKKMAEFKPRTDSELLAEMIELQKVIDQKIFRKFGVSYEDVDLESALLDEVGELNHEIKPTRCWWKEHPGVIDSAKVLEEFVDCIHVILMMAIGEDSVNSLMLGFEAAHKEVPEFIESYNPLDLMQDNIMDAGYVMYVLAKKLRFDWFDVYQAYKQKNAENHHRAETGY